MAVRTVLSPAARLNTLVLSVAAFVLLAMVGLAYWEWRQYALVRAIDLRTRDVQDSVQKLLSSLGDAESGQRGFLLTGDDQFLEPYRPAVQVVTAELANLNRLLTPAQAGPDSQMARLNSLVNLKLAELAETVDLRRRLGITPALEVVLSGRGRESMEQIRAICSGIRQKADAEMGDIRSQAMLANQGAMIVTVVGSLLLLAFFVVGNATINRAILAREEALANAQNARNSLRTTLASIGDAVISTDPEGRIVFANRVAQELLRVGEADMAGKHLDEVFVVLNEFTRDRVESPVTRVLREGAVVGLANHSVLIGRDGIETPIDDSGAPIRGEDGPIQGAVVVFRDTTERRKAENALLEREQRFRTLADTAPVMIWVSGLDKKCTWFNRTWLDFTGRTMEQELGDGWAEGVHPGDLEKSLATYAGSFDRQEAFQMEYRLRRHDGHWRWIVDHGVPLKHADGTFLGYIGSCIDVHERKQAEETLRITNEALQEFADIVDPAAVMVRDTDDRIVRWTSGAHALYGFTAAEALGQVSHDLFKTVFPEPLDQIRAKLLASGRWEGELRHRLRNGREIAVSSVWALHRNRQGEPAAILVVNTDITERKRLEQQIRLRVEELEAYLDATPACVWVAHDAGCTRITGNRTANQTLGVEAETNVSQTPGDLSSVRLMQLKPDGTEYRPEELPMQQAVATRQTVNNAEIEFVFPDGRRILVSGNAAPLFDTVGHVRGCVGVFLDTTERKLAEERFHLAVEASPNGMVLANEVGTILLVNSEMERLFGYTREEMMGQPIEILIPHQFMDDHRRYRESYYADSRARRMGEGRDLYGRRKSGSEFPVEIALNPIQTGHGRMVLSAVVDITERKRMEKESAELLANQRALAAERALRETEAELARVVRVLSVGELAASIAHEVNQPLAGVVTNAEAGLRWLGGATPNLQEARESLALIVRDGNRASAVIRRIREFLKKESQESTSLDMNEVIEETLALAGPELVKRRISRRTVLSQGLPTVRGDRIQLQQVILNLVMNASEAMASTGGSKEMLLTSERSADGGVLVAVRDSGVGINPGDIDRMFDAFFTTKAEGIGMGLSISRSIVEAHGGRIWAEPNDGPGLTVQFQLTAGEQAANPDGVSSSSLVS